MMAASSVGKPRLGVDDDGPPRVEDANEVVQTVVEVLQKRFYKFTGKNLAGVVKSGSLGQGTTVPGNFDADLILLSRDITPELMADTDGEAKRLVLALRKLILDSESLGDFCQVRKPTIAKGFLLLRFDVELPSKPVISVDLAMGPYWEDDIRVANAGIWNFKRQHLEEWKVYNKLLLPSIGKWQMKFIVAQPNRVKELIRRVKKWQKEQWPDSYNGKPSSYLLAILIVEACREWCRDNQKQCNEDLDEVRMSPSQRTSFQSGVQKIFERLVINHRLLRLFLQPQQPWFVFPRDAKSYPQIDDDEPFILDPACVYHNLYKVAIKPCSGTYYVPNHDWGLFVRKIQIDRTLDLTKSLF